MKLVVGLGNPGKEYEPTRHNAGFWLVELPRAARARCSPSQVPGASGAWLRGRPTTAWLLLPQTFMNASGRAVQMLAGFFKIEPEEILVVHDELDFAPGTARLKKGGGIAGHNGLKDIPRLGPDYWRLRLGIGQPGDAPRSSTTCSTLRGGGDRSHRRRDRAQPGIWPLILAGEMEKAMQKLHTQPKD